MEKYEFSPPKIGSASLCNVPFLNSSPLTSPSGLAKLPPKSAPAYLPKPHLP
jgi:hypothetical protein